MPGFVKDFNELNIICPQEEGYGMDWSSTRQGYLLTGDCTRHIHLWTPRESDWLVSQQTFSAHGSSVEDIQVSQAKAYSSSVHLGKLWCWILFSSCYYTDLSVRYIQDVPILLLCIPECAIINGLLSN